MSPEQKEKVSKSGLLIVTTGCSGSGKDSVTIELRKNKVLEHLGLTQVITTASRKKRDNEEHGREYYFSDLETMRRMEEDGEFIEPLTQTGDETDWKATQKKELLKVLEDGINLIWRIDLTRAADVAKGDYFHQYLDAETAQALHDNTIVILIETDPDIDLMEVRRKRDGEKFNDNTYIERDKQDLCTLTEKGHHFKHRVVNKWGKLDETTQEVSNLILEFIRSKQS